MRSSHTWPAGELTGTFCQVTVAHTVVTVESQPLSRSLTLLCVSRPRRQTAVSLTTAIPSRDDYIAVWQTHTCSAFLPNNLLPNGTEQSTPEADHHTDVSEHAAGHTHLKTMCCPTAAATVRTRRLICLVIQHVSWLLRVWRCWVGRHSLHHR